MIPSKNSKSSFNSSSFRNSSSLKCSSCFSNFLIIVDSNLERAVLLEESLKGLRCPGGKLKYGGINLKQILTERK